MVGPLLQDGPAVGTDVLIPPSLLTIGVDGLPSAASALLVVEFTGSGTWVSVTPFFAVAPVPDVHAEWAQPWVFSVQVVFDVTNFYLVGSLVPPLSLSIS